MAASAVQQKSIQAFGSVSKANVALSDAKKRKALDEDDSIAMKPLKAVKIAPASTNVVNKSQKRSRDADSSDEDLPTKRVHASDPISSSPSSALSNLKLQSPRRAQRSPHTPLDTPSKGTRRLLAGLALEKSSPIKIAPTRISPTPHDESTPPTSPCSSSNTASELELPEEVEDLISLHASFLTALSLHYAHNGASSPVDVSILTPSIAKVWGKRKVTLEDVRRTVAVMENSRSTRESHIVKLSDYGHGKICIEKQTTLGSNNIMARSLDETRLNRTFEEQIRSLWMQQTKNASCGSTDPDTVRLFIQHLPLAEITVCPSLAKTAPLLAKGQRRLDDMMKDRPLQRLHAALVQPHRLQDNNTEVSAEVTPKAVPAASRATSLLDRILAKQTLASTFPTPPSAAELARRAALQRCEEVLNVLSVLAASRNNASGRVSFSMAMLIQSLRGSVRNPISKEEVEAVVDVLAKEVCPRYVSVVALGGEQGKAVVVSAMGKMGTGTVREKVRVLLG